MSKKKNHFYHISISAGQYPSVAAALADVEAFRMHLKRKCKNNGYSCICYAGVSENDHDAGQIRCGKQGKKVFIAYENADEITIDPHIHIILLANPGETVAKLTRAYFARKGIEAYHYRCDDYSMSAIVYAMRQSKKCRTIACNADQLPHLMVSHFCTIAEAANEILNGCTPVFKNLSEPFFRNIPATDPFKLLVHAELAKANWLQEKTA